MTDILSNVKRTVAWSVAVAIAAVSLLALAPATANAQTAGAPTLDTGDRIKCAGTALFAINSNMRKVPIFNAESHNTYWADFTGTKAVTAENCGAFPAPESDQPQMLMYRPGSNLVKTPFNAKVYAVGPGQTLMGIEDPQAAEALHGSDWATEIRDISPLIKSTAYTESGMTLDGSMPYNGQLITTANKSGTFIVWADKVWELEGSIPSRLQSQVEEVSTSVFNSKSMASQTVTAEEAVQLSLNSVLEVDQDQNGDDQNGDDQNGDDDNGDDNGDDQNGDDDNGDTAQGTLNVTLSANTPESQTVPTKATHVEYLSFNLEAGSEDVTLDSITAQRYGLGSDNDFDEVWLEVDGNPVTGGRSISSDDNVQLSPNYTIGAGQTVEFTLVADMDADNSNQNGFRITSADMIETDGDVDITGDFNISGNKMDYSSYEIADVTVDDRGTDTEVQSGDEEITIGEFETDYSANEGESDGEIEYMKFEQVGDADMDDLKNMKLFEDGSEVPGEVMIAGDYVTFMPDDSESTIEDGETRRFSIRADIENADDGDIVRFDIDDTRDIFIREKNTGFGSDVSENLGCGTNNDSLCDYTIDAGQLSVALDSSSPGSEEYAKGTQDVTALVGKTNLGQDIMTDGLDVRFHVDSDISNGSSTEVSRIEDDIERAELMVNDKRVSSLTSPIDIDDDDDSSIDNSNDVAYEFDSSFSLSDDDKIKLMLDFDDEAETNTYKFTFDSSDFDDPEYKSTSEDVDSNDKSGTVTGNNIDIVDASLSITRNDGYNSNETFVIGSGDNQYLKTLFKAGDSSDLNIQTLKFDFPGITKKESTTYFTNFEVRFDGQKVGDSEDMNYDSTDGAMTFDNLNYTVEKNDSVEISLHGSIQKGLNDGTTSKITLNQNDSLIENQEGDEVSGWSSVDSADPLKFIENAALTAKLDSDTPDEGLLAANSNSEVATYRFSAEDGDIEISDLYLGHTTSTPNSTSTISNLNDLISSYELVVDGDVVDTSAPSDEGGDNNGAFEFNLGSGNEIMVEKDKVQRVKVKANLNDITNQRSLSERDINVTLYGIEGETRGSGTELTPSDINSGNDDIQTDNTLDIDAIKALKADRQVAARTIPSIEATSVSNNTLSDGGGKEVFSYEVTANDNYDVSWKRVTIEMTGNCNTDKLDDCVSKTPNDWTVEEGSTERTINNITFTSSTDSDLTAEIELSNSRSISAGASKEYTISTKLSGFTGDNDSLSTQIVDNETASSDPDEVDTYSTVKGNSDTFVWSDNSVSYDDTSDKQWFDGWELPGLDTDSISLTR